jgi:integrase
MKQAIEKKTRRKNGEGSISKTKDGRWIAAVTVRDDSSNKRERIKRSGKTKDDAIATLKKALIDKGVYLEDEPAREEIIVTSKSPLSEIIREFKINGILARVSSRELGRQVKRGTIASSTAANYIWELDVMDKEIGHKAVGELTKSDLTRFFLKKKSELSDESMRKIFVVSNGMFVRAVNELRILRENPYGSRFDIPCSTVKKRNVDAYTCADVKIILDSVRDDPFLFPLVMFSLHTGMRTQEIRAIKWEDIDFEKREVNVNKAWKRQITFESDGKTANEIEVLGVTKSKKGQRIIDIGQDMVLVLNEWRRFIEDYINKEWKSGKLVEKKGSDRTMIRDSDFVFRSSKKNHDHWGYSGIQSALQRAFGSELYKKMSDKDGLNWHRFRHTAATILANEERGAYAVALFLGEDERSASRYVNANKDLRAKNSEIISGKFSDVFDEGIAT